MEFIEEKNRIFVEQDGRRVAEIIFEKKNDDTYVITHTFVDEALRGEGIGSKLVSRAVNKIKKEGYNVEATCSYAKAWLEKHGK